MSGESRYLTRKQLVHVEGIRYANDFIAALIINTEGVGQGLQKIFTDGRKQFTYGLQKKGHFAILGAEVTALPRHTAKVFVCEGLATGMSIYLACGQPVFCALDAGNLAPVVKNIRRHFKQADVIIWADNDQWKAEQVGPKGAPLGNTGLIAAHSVAMRTPRVRVIAPDFSDVDVSSQPTDFNDLHQLAGLLALLQGVAQPPHPEYAFFHTAQKVKQGIHALAVNSARCQLLDCRYLPNEVAFVAGLHVIRSPIGTGKTQLMATLTQSRDSVVYISHLVSLVEDAASRLHLTSYNHCGVFCLRETTRLAICVNSLGKLSQRGHTPVFEVVILDEIEQLFRRLTTDIANKPLVLATLRYLILNAKVVIALDAHVSRRTRTLLSAMCPDKPLHVLINEYKVGQGRTVRLYTDKESLQQQAIQALIHGHRCFLTFNSKAEAAKFYALLQSLYPDKQGLFISADNAGDAAVQAFIADVNQVSLGYDYVITTPSMNTGVSIDNHHFTFVGGCFCNLVNTPEDAMQALGRVRHAHLIHVYVDRHARQLPTDETTLSAKWLETHAYDQALMGISSDGERVISDAGYHAIYLSVTQAKNRGMNQFFYQFCLLLFIDGYTIEYEQHPLAQDVKKDIKEVKTTLAIAAYQQRVLTAEPLTKHQFAELTRLNRRTLTETAQVEKYRLQQFYRLSVQTPKATWLAVIIHDHHGQQRQAILTLERALSTTEALNTLYLQQTLEYPQFIPDMKHYATEAELYRQLLTALELIHPEQGLQLNTQFNYSKETLAQGSFIAWVIQQRGILLGIMTIPSIASLQQNPLRFVSTLLKKLGLKQQRVGQHAKGMYRIEETSLTLMHELLQHRQGQRPGVTPLADIPLPPATLNTLKHDTIAQPLKKHLNTKALEHTNSLIHPETNTVCNTASMGTLNLYTTINSSSVPLSFVSLENQMYNLLLSLFSREDISTYHRLMLAQHLLATLIPHPIISEAVMVNSLVSVLSMSLWLINQTDTPAGEIIRQPNHSLNPFFCIRHQAYHLKDTRDITDILNQDIIDQCLLLPIGYQLGYSPTHPYSVGGLTTYVTHILRSNSYIGWRVYLDYISLLKALQCA